MITLKSIHLLEALLYLMLVQVGIYCREDAQIMVSLVRR